jgi:hypothetical protein
LVEVVDAPRRAFVGLFFAAVFWAVVQRAFLGAAERVFLGTGASLLSVDSR